MPAPFQRQNVMITAAARNRLLNDEYVQNRLKKYINTIKKIMAVGRKYQTEKIGDFFVSPRGKINVRVAWYEEKDTLVIYDFLYEKETGRYVDDWNKKAGNLEITRGSPQYHNRYLLDNVPELAKLV